MTPLQHDPWTQPKPTLPLDVLDSCNNAQVRQWTCVYMCVSISFPVSRVRVKPCSRLDSVSPNASHPYLNRPRPPTPASHGPSTDTF
jgi:hypothetical protein